MARRIYIGDLNELQEKLVVENAINQILEALDLSDARVFPQIVTTDPNGNLSGKKGQIITYDNGATLVLKQNTTGGTVWRTVA